MLRPWTTAAWDWFFGPSADASAGGSPTWPGELTFANRKFRTPSEATSIGNILVQALALGHLNSLDDARKVVRESFTSETIQPYAAAWNSAYDRLQKWLG